MHGDVCESIPILGGKKKLNKKIRNSQFAISQCCGNYGSRVID